MAKLLWAVLVQRPIMDRQSNNVSLVDVLEQIVVKDLPPTLGSEVGMVLGLPFTLVTLWRRAELNQPENFAARVRLLAPDDTELHEQKLQINLESNPRHRWLSRYAGLPFRGFGAYRFVIEVSDAEGWNAVGEQILDVALDEDGG